MPRTEGFQLRTSENRNIPVRFDDLHIVWWFDKTTRFVSLPSYRSWSFIQLTVSVFHLLASVNLFLSDYGTVVASRARNNNEQTGRLLNTASALVLSFVLCDSFLSSHEKWCTMLKSSWWGANDYNIKTYLKRSQKKVLVYSLLGSALALCLSGSLLLEIFTSVNCHFGVTSPPAGGSKHLGLLSLVLTTVFAVTLTITLVTAFVNILFLSLANTVFAESLFNQLGIIVKSDNTLGSVLELSKAYKPMLANGASVFPVMIRGFYYLYPCILAHTTLALFPQQNKTTASLSQMCFPVFSALTIVFLTYLASCYRNWRDEIHARLEHLFLDDQAGLVTAKAEFDYPENPSPFPKIFSFGFPVSALVILSLFSLMVGVGVTLVQLYFSYKLHLF